MLEKNDLEGIELFAFLGDEERENLGKSMDKKTYYKGEFVFSEDDKGGALYVLKSGSIRIYKVIREGEKQVLSVLNAGEHFGAISLIDGQEHSATAEAIADSVILKLPGAEFDKFASNFPAAALTLLNSIVVSLCSFVRVVNKKFVDMVQYITLDR